MRIVALIPARAGSKRIPGKNTKLLGGKPLIQWTIEAAKASGVFHGIAVSSDDRATRELVARMGDVSTLNRPHAFAADDSPDIEWIRHAFDWLGHSYTPDAFAILRPTSPFRTAATIRRAVEQFKTAKCSSLRAVERVKQHPGKMWMWNAFLDADKSRIEPLLPGDIWDYSQNPHGDGTPWHSMPTQSLPHVYVQNSSLEIAHRWCVDIFGTISGPKVAPFFTEGMEGFSIDYPEDWERAERHVAALQATPATL